MNIVEESRTYALAEIEKYGSPPLVIFSISEKKAIELAKKLKADDTIVKVGVALMDIKLGQALKEGRLKEHVSMSVQAAKEFLSKFKLDETSQNKIINCIEAHHKDVNFNCIEAEICANADCYRFLHPRGVFAYFNILGERAMDFDACLNQVESKLEEKHNILSLDICKKELEPHYQMFKKYIAEARKL